MVYPYDEIGFSKKKDPDTNISYNRDELQNHDTKYSKSEKRNTTHHLYVESKKVDTNELSYKTETDSQT